MAQTPHKFTVERLHHYNCGSCSGWWAIGDAPKRKLMYCPHCGYRAGLVELDTPAPKLVAETERKLDEPLDSDGYKALVGKRMRHHLKEDRGLDLDDPNLVVESFVHDTSLGNDISTLIFEFGGQKFRYSGVERVGFFHLNRITLDNL